MNECIISGRLTQNPHKTETGAYFTLAVQHDYKEEDGTRSADFLPISVFGEQAEHVCKYLVKGDVINVIAKATSYRKEGINKISFKLRRYEFVKVKYFDHIERDGNWNATGTIPTDAELPAEMSGEDAEEE